MSISGCKRATVQFITRIQSDTDDIFLTDITGSDWLNFWIHTPSQNEILDTPLKWRTAVTPVG